MAKAKKAESEKQPAKKSAKPGVPAAAPLIDTNLAAQNAARMLAAGLGKPTTSAPQAESAMFKQLKAGVGKPTSTNPLLDGGATAFPSKSSNSFKSGSQTASYHANVAKTGVPRRNPG